MATTAVIIGLGEIGSSIAMALKAQGDLFTVIGSDFERSAEKTAETNQWVDRTEHNLYKAVQDADWVILAIPADQTAEVLELAGHDLKDGALILDFSPAKKAAAGWARQYLKHPENFLGVWAGVNPQYLDEPSCGGGSARADLFKGSTLFAAAEADTSEAVIGFVSSFAGMLGMECSFAEPQELDGMIAAVYQFPAVAAGAMLSCLSKRSGWTDGKKAAGKIFYSMTAPAVMRMDQTETGTALLKNRENTVRILNDYIAELVSFRDVLQGKDETALRAVSEEDQRIREQWEKDYRKPNRTGEEAAVSINASEMINQVFFGGLLRKKKGN